MRIRVEANDAFGECAESKINGGRTDPLATWASQKQSQISIRSSGGPHTQGIAGGTEEPVP